MLGIEASSLRCEQDMDKLWLRRALDLVCREDDDGFSRLDD